LTASYVNAELLDGSASFKSVQPLEGQRVVAPDPMALVSLAISDVDTVLALGWIGLGYRSARNATSTRWQYSRRRALFDPKRNDRSVAAMVVLPRAPICRLRLIFWCTRDIFGRANRRRVPCYRINRSWRHGDRL
jgi:hypothetical protein